MPSRPGTTVLRSRAALAPRPIPGIEPARGLARSPSSTAEALFDRVAPRYDLTNAALTLGLHALWRRQTVRALDLRPRDRVLDLCAGTLELSAEVRRVARGARITALDRSQGMLSLGLSRRPVAPAVQGCALALPFASSSFDAAAVAFGLRNVPERRRALLEVARVLAPGGRFAILELVSPKDVLARAAHLLGVRFLVPLVGGALGSDPRAYRYLARSIEAFLDLDALSSLVASAGFRVLERRLLPPHGPAALVVAARA